MTQIIEKIRAALRRLELNRRLAQLEHERQELWRRYHLTNRKVGIGAVVGVLLVGLFIWWHHTPAQTARTAALPVVAATAAKGNIDITYTALGTVTPLASVTVRTQIAGQLMQVAFKEGDVVKQGDFLAEIDPRPYQAALDQAQGQLARDEALLKSAQIDFVRYRTLAAQDSIAKQTVDDQEYLVHQYEGTVKLDQGNVDNARLNLAYCHITAPVAGLLGLRQVDPGNYVQTSDVNGIVLINQMQPISVLFALPEDDLPSILARTHTGAVLPSAAFDRTGVTKIADGNLATVDNTINVTTGTFQLRASFPNTNNMLYPNQFVNVQLTVDTLRDAVVIPSAAIQRGAPGTFVYVVKPDNTVAIQVVTLGPAQGEHQAISKGLNLGDKVVVDGADKLRAGSTVVLRSATPETPNPDDNTPPAAAEDQPQPGQPGSVEQPNSGPPGTAQPNSDQPANANQTPAPLTPDQQPVGSQPGQHRHNGGNGPGNNGSGTNGQ
ncbi:MAG TPA: efflux RND transporter periplasmic adaptor subunit [Stellaceae bacterium]|jgi:multidrug efflux system membrane fusion protein|nr:efflux RND transporter periplasmic adaptor subunit [Stellaceae bacterium]